MLKISYAHSCVGTFYSLDAGEKRSKIPQNGLAGATRRSYIIYRGFNTHILFTDVLIYYLHRLKNTFLKIHNVMEAKYGPNHSRPVDAVIVFIRYDISCILVCN